jgi:hypothetical protein
MMKKIASKIGIGVFVIAFLFFGLKGFLKTVWSSPKTPEIYSIQGQDGRIGSIIFLPNNETMLWDHNPGKDSTEGVLTKMRGSYGTHYFLRLWKIDGPGITFGYRIYPANTEPVNMEITVLEKYIRTKGEPVFPEKGDKRYQVLLFGKNMVNFQDMWFEREPNNSEMVQTLLALLGGSKEREVLGP